MQMLPAPDLLPTVEHIKYGVIVVLINSEQRPLSARNFRSVHSRPNLRPKARKGRSKLRSEDRRIKGMRLKATSATERLPNWTHVTARDASASARTNQGAKFKDALLPQSYSAQFRLRKCSCKAFLNEFFKFAYLCLLVFVS